MKWSRVTFLFVERNWTLANECLWVRAEGKMTSNDSVASFNRHSLKSWFNGYCAVMFRLQCVGRNAQRR